MYNKNLKITICSKARVMLLLSFSMMFISCASMDARKIDVTIKPEAPVKKVTSFDHALTQLGKMTKIYGTDALNVMCRDIYDKTGTASSTGGEIPFEITEMVKTTLNSIGGNVTYIPYNPSNLIILQQARYSNFANKKIPHVVITGGITEFDRGLEVRGENLDMAADTKPFTNAPDWFPGKVIGFDSGRGGKQAISRITVDFNVLDFQANAGIAQMQTVNTIQVQKAVAESELAFTLFGPTFGLKGNIKKIQGRHAAVRLLVHLSMLQLIGKYFDLPYWELLPDAELDPVVVDIVATDFYNMDELTRTVKIQELLALHGYDVPLSKTMNIKTQEALKAFDDNYEIGSDIDKDLFLKLYFSVPLTDEALKRRYAFKRRFNTFITALNAEKPAGPEATNNAPDNKSKETAGKSQNGMEKDEVFNQILILFENKN